MKGLDILTGITIFTAVVIPSYFLEIYYQDDKTMLAYQGGFMVALITLRGLLWLKAHYENT